ncbi:MAG: hypothetical protein K8S13_24110 [Desulfobacula sp.]|uniref:hypothetical protein n=1 Tax=Desulfobacula sp. TaxID=2593537 RepID=UPI0025B88496|nr:hypothetical protein [Desulfobacula sp.]MCD4722914.1 hypothetical protein [Desulfobacula sp.]
MKKLLVCDVEGTIFQAKFKIDGTDYASTMWQPIADAIRTKKETNKTSISAFKKMRRKLYLI